MKLNALLFLAWWFLKTVQCATFTNYLSLEDTKIGDRLWEEGVLEEPSLKDDITKIEDTLLKELASEEHRIEDDVSEDSPLDESEIGDTLNDNTGINQFYPMPIWRPLPPNLHNLTLNTTHLGTLYKRSMDGSEDRWGVPQYPPTWRPTRRPHYYRSAADSEDRYSHISSQASARGCEVNGKLYSNGAEINYSCYTYTCKDGSINTTMDTNCCYYKSSLYSNGATIKDNCYNLTCIDGSINKTMDTNCKSKN